MESLHGITHFLHKLLFKHINLCTKLQYKNLFSIYLKKQKKETFFFPSLLIFFYIYYNLFSDIAEN